MDDRAVADFINCLEIGHRMGGRVRVVKQNSGADGAMAPGWIYRGSDHGRIDCGIYPVELYFSMGGVDAVKMTPSGEVELQLGAVATKAKIINCVVSIGLAGEVGSIILVKAAGICLT